MSHKLYRVAWHIMGSRQDAEDIMQEAYLKLWEKRSSLGSVVNVEAYCITLVKRLCYDALHEHRGDEELSDCITDGAHDDMGMRDDALHVRRFISLLPEQQRQVITMRDVDDRSFKDIERSTGLSAVNIRVLLSRARKKIREQFKTLLDNENR